MASRRPDIGFTRLSEPNGLMTINLLKLSRILMMTPQILKFTRLQQSLGIHDYNPHSEPYWILTITHLLRTGYGGKQCSYLFTQDMYFMSCDFFIDLFCLAIKFVSGDRITFLRRHKRKNWGLRSPPSHEKFVKKNEKKKFRQKFFLSRTGRNCFKFLCQFFCRILVFENLN